MSFEGFNCGAVEIAQHVGKLQPRPLLHKLVYSDFSNCRIRVKSKSYSVKNPLLEKVRLLIQSKTDVEPNGSCEEDVYWV